MLGMRESRQSANLTMPVIRVILICKEENDVYRRLLRGGMNFLPLTVHRTQCDNRTGRA